MGLHLHPLDISDPAITYLCLGGFVVFFSMISLIAKEKLYIGESVLATAFGIIIGPYCANIFNPRSWNADSNAITLEVMRITLAAGLFAIGVELPQAYLARHWKSLVVMVIPTMAIGWITSAGFMYGLFPGLSFISALCISACLTPTDPILAVAITSGKFAEKHVPVNIRHIIAAESAANDGLAYPFLSISIYLSIESSKRIAIAEWFLLGWLYQVILGVAIGACLGYCFSHLMKYSLKKQFIDKESYVAQYIALALLSIGLTNILGSDDLLAAFAAGKSSTAISWDGDFKMQTENAVFSSVIDLVLNCGAFIYIGAWLPFDLYNSPELRITPWRLVILFLCLLVFRRLPSLLALYRWIPDVNNWQEALFSGHFGPMGVGAIFISTLALSRLPEPQTPPANQQERLAASLHPIVSFVVLGSILIHGLSIPFFSLGRRTISMTSTWSRFPPTPDWLNMTRRVEKHERSDSDDVDSMEQGARVKVVEVQVVNPSMPPLVHSRSTTLVRGNKQTNAGAGLSAPAASRPQSIIEAISDTEGGTEVEFQDSNVVGKRTNEELGAQAPTPNFSSHPQQLTNDNPPERRRAEPPTGLVVQFRE